MSAHDGFPSTVSGYKPGPGSSGNSSPGPGTSLSDTDEPSQDAGDGAHTPQNLPPRSAAKALQARRHGRLGGEVRATPPRLGPAVGLPVRPSAARDSPRTPARRRQGGTEGGTTPHSSHLSHASHPMVERSRLVMRGLNGRGWDRTSDLPRVNCPEEGNSRERWD